MDLKDLQNLIRFVSKADIAEVKYKTKEYKISIRTSTYSRNVGASLPLVQSSSTASLSNSPNSNISHNKNKDVSLISNDKYFTIKSPMIGTFYQKSGPEKPLFVKEGDIITPGKVLCIIEAMKLFNEIESEVSGKIIKILVEDSTPVEYDQPLFLVDLIN